MPPKKRAGSTSNAARAQPKKSKSNPDDKSSDMEWIQVLHRSSRWAEVSGSRNADAEYKWLQQKEGEESAYSYQCLCQPPWEVDSDEDEEDSDSDEDGEDEEDDEEGSKKEKVKCDAGKTCLCGKPASEHPDHHWIISHAGLQKFNTQRTMCYLRCPDAFDMHIYNDFEGYGVLEVLENLLLDFVEADGNWKEQWVVCETMVWFLLDDASEPMMMIDDGQRLDQTIQLVGRVFLSMLALLGSKKLLAYPSEVMDLGVVMALYMKMAQGLRGGFSLLEGEEEDKNGVNICQFDNYVLAYANKYGIPLQGPDDVDEIAAECDGTVSLPVATAANPDPWGAMAAIQKYEKGHGSTKSRKGRGTKAAIGGDSHDITAFSSAERKAHSYNKKDPLGKQEILSLAMGMIPQPA